MKHICSIKTAVAGIGLVLVILAVWWHNPKSVVEPDTTTQSQAFLKGGLKTDTSIASIPLDLVLTGTPSRDNIPAIDTPTFVTAEDAMRTEALADDVLGILVAVHDTVRFYPYTVMVWHEIVNDVIDSVPLVITFCPLCGSAVVYETGPLGSNDMFGVSGKLYESNLLMYDHRTESLWSQALGEAVVGARTGEALTVYPSQLLTFSEARNKHPSLVVLSRDTGFKRDYGVYPYGNYEESDTLYFDVTVRDTRLPLKELMYVVEYQGQSVAFVRKDVLAQKEAQLVVHGVTLTASVDGSEIVVRSPDGEVLPGYVTMWFSWATHYGDDGVVWTR